MPMTTAVSARPLKSRSHWEISSPQDGRGQTIASDAIFDGRRSQMFGFSPQLPSCLLQPLLVAKVVSATCPKIYTSQISLCTGPSWIFLSSKCVSPLLAFKSSVPCWLAPALLKRCWSLFSKAQVLSDESIILVLSGVR